MMNRKKKTKQAAMPAINMHELPREENPLDPPTKNKKKKKKKKKKSLDLDPSDETTNPLDGKQESLGFRRLQTSVNGREMEKKEQTTDQKAMGRNSTSQKSVTNPMTRVNRMFRRLETSIGGRKYFENVDKPGQTTWEIPEGATVIGKASTKTKKKSSSSSPSSSSSCSVAQTKGTELGTNHRKALSSRQLIEMSILTDDLLALPVENVEKEEQKLLSSVSSKSYKRPTCSVINFFRLCCGTF